MHQRTKQTALLGLNLQELTKIMEEFGEPAYRSKQLFESLYRQRIISIDQISTLPQDLRQKLQTEGFLVGLPTIEKKFQSSDGTIRYLIACSDNQSVETVWMPEGDGGENGDGSVADEQLETSGRNWHRATICVSSQVGCAVDCQFCLTAQLGLKRNLTAGEIVGQICTVLNDQNVSVSNDRINIVFMGMGEPLLNYDNFVKAVQLLVKGIGIPESRMTVSTSGIVPRIYDLGAEPIRPKVAISLNATNDKLRTEIMPINRKWNLELLMKAAREFPFRHREKATFEYVMLDEVNDSPEHARELVELVRGIRAKVNLISWNSGPGIAFKTPDQKRVLSFQKILMEAGVPTFIRRPRGRDIYAACGQLKRTLEVQLVT